MLGQRMGYEISNSQMQYDAADKKTGQKKKKKKKKKKTNKKKKKRSMLRTP